MTQNSIIDRTISIQDSIFSEISFIPDCQFEVN